MATSESLALISSYRSARSRSARGVMLTRYAMPGFELFEKLPCRPDLSFPRVLQPLTDAFFCVGAGGNVEQALISSGVLHDGFCLSFHGKHHRALAPLKLFRLKTESLEIDTALAESDGLSRGCPLRVKRVDH